MTVLEIGLTLGSDIVIVGTWVTEVSCVPVAYQIIMPIIVFILNIVIVKLVPFVYKKVYSFHARRKFLKLLKSLETIFENVYDPSFDIDSMRKLLTNDFFKIEIQKIEVAILKDRYVTAFSKDLFIAQALKSKGGERKRSKDSEKKNRTNSKDKISGSPEKNNRSHSKDKIIGSPEKKNRSHSKDKIFSSPEKKNRSHSKDKTNGSPENEQNKNFTFIPKTPEADDNNLLLNAPNHETHNISLVNTPDKSHKCEKKKPFSNLSQDRVSKISYKSLANTHMELCCPICLDVFNEGDKLMYLPRC